MNGSSYRGDSRGLSHLGDKLFANFFPQRVNWNIDDLEAAYGSYDLSRRGEVAGPPGNAKRVTREGPVTPA